MSRLARPQEPDQGLQAHWKGRKLLDRGIHTPQGVTRRTTAKGGSAKKGGKGKTEPATPGADDDSDAEPKKDERL